MSPTHPSKPPVAAPASTLVAWRQRLEAPAELLSALTSARAQALATLPLHLWIHLCPTAVWAAQLADLQQRLSETSDAALLQQRYPLLGAPFAVKDNMHIAGAPTSAACLAFTRTATSSATVVRKLLDAGALWLGKTNLDQFATGLVGARCQGQASRPLACTDRAGLSGGTIKCIDMLADSAAHRTP